MKWKPLLIACLSACLVLSTCKSGPSSPEKDKASILERNVGFLEDLVSRRGLAARMWSELAAALPDRLWPTEVVYDGMKVKVTGNALSNDLLADFLSRLEGSAGLSGAELRTSVQKSGRTGDYHEFTVVARVGEAGRKPSGSAAGSLEGRLQELEKTLASRPDPGENLRELQRLASESGLQMTKCVFGQPRAGEFAGELSVSIEVAGSRTELGRYLDGMARLPRFWLVKQLSIKAVDTQDARSPIRASIAAQAYFPN